MLNVKFQAVFTAREVVKCKTDQKALRAFCGIDPVATKILFLSFNFILG